MIKFTLGFILGVAAATVGFSGLVNMADRGVQETKRVVNDVANGNAASDAKRAVSNAVEEVTK